MCETDPGALVKATLLQKSITVQYVAYVRYARTAGAAAEVVKQPEHVRPVGLQTRVVRGNRLRGASSNPRVVESEPRISLAGWRSNCPWVYVAHCAPSAVLLTGSAAEGLAEAYSDLDVIAY